MLHYTNYLFQHSITKSNRFNTALPNQTVSTQHYQIKPYRSNTHYQLKPFQHSITKSNRFNTALPNQTVPFQHNITKTNSFTSISKAASSITHCKTSFSSSHKLQQNVQLLFYKTCSKHFPQILQPISFHFLSSKIFILYLFPSRNSICAFP
jgi:hypothetical protein